MLRTHSGGARRRIAIGALALAVALGVGAWLRWTTPEQVQDLRPRSDALEYEEAARSLARGDGFVITIAGQEFPPAHPFGFAALMAPYLFVADGGFGSGIHVVLGCALLAITATYLLGATTGGIASATVAALLLATNAVHVSWSRAVMSDVPATAATALLAWWTLRILDRPCAPTTVAVLGLASGLAASIRSPSLLLLVPTVALLLAARWSLRARLEGVVALGIGTVVGMLPTTAYNAVTFGSPWRDGIDFWAPGPHFGPELVLVARESGGEPNHLYYPRLLLGFGSLYPLPIALLIAAGIVLGVRRGGRPRRLVVLAVGFTVLVLVSHVPLVWQWTRYFLLPLPLLLAVGALVVARSAAAWLRIVGVGLAAAGIALVLRQPAPYAPPDGPLGEVAALRAMNDEVEPNAIILARTTAIMFERLLRDGADRALVPVGVDEFQLPILMRKLPPLRSAGADGAWLRAPLPRPHQPSRVLERVEALLAEGRPVYYSPMLGHLARDMAGVPAILMRRFRLRRAGRTGAVPLFRIEPRA